MRKIKWSVMVKRGTGRYKTIHATYSHEKTVAENVSHAVALERGLNNGLLAYEAELAYPRIGFHNKPIYKIHVGTKDYNVV